MRPTAAAAVLAVLGALQVPLSLGEDRPLDKRLVVARNVALGFDTGAEFTMNESSIGDRETLFAVRQEIERWGRYWIVSKRDDAELLIAIRVRGVLVATGDGIGGGGVRRDGLVFRGAGAPKADMLTVYDARHKQLGVPLWRGQMVGGLSGDRPPLLDGLRADVERCARQP